MLSLLIPSWKPAAFLSIRSAVSDWKEAFDPRLFNDFTCSSLDYYLTRSLLEPSTGLLGGSALFPWLFISCQPMFLFRSLSRDCLNPQDECPTWLCTIWLPLRSFWIWSSLSWASYCFRICWRVVPTSGIALFFLSTSLYWLYWISLLFCALPCGFVCCSRSPAIGPVHPWPAAPDAWLFLSWFMNGYAVDYLWEPLFCCFFPESSCSWPESDSSWLR